MYITVLRLQRSQSYAKPLPAAAVLEDILWTAALANDHLEHVYVSVGVLADVGDVVLFQRSGPAAVGRLQGLELCWRALAASPLLAGWSAALVRAGPVR